MDETAMSEVVRQFAADYERAKDRIADRELEEEDTLP